MDKSISKIAETYNFTNKSLYPYEYYKDEQSHNNILGNQTREDFKPLLTIKLPSQDEVETFNKANSKNTGKKLTLEYMHNYI